MRIYHSKILTVDRNNSVLEWLVEDNGRIVYVGNELPSKYKNESIIELMDKTICPTFCDTHQHFASFSLFNAGLNVMNATSNKEILEMASEFVKRSKDEILIAFGASPYSVLERKLLCREELDSVCNNRPFFMVKYDGHACIVNSVLLERINDKIKNLRGYHPDTGEMNQEAFFAVSDYITNSISIPTLIKNMQKAVDFEVSKGIGMIHTVSGVGFPLNLDISIEKWFAKSIEHGMQIRVFPQSMNTNVAELRKLPRIGGCFQCALDGCFGSQDAAMIQPYSNNLKNSGVLYYSDEEVIDFCKKANRAGLQIEMHAIGDKAFNQATKALKAALDDCPREDHRHGIIHACLPTNEGKRICEEYHIQLPMQIAFDNWRQEPFSYTKELLGIERNNQLNPIKSFMESGCIVSFGSDGPCTTPDPIVWLYKAVNHSNSNESISIEDALRMSTYNGYWTTFDEKERGSLEVGKICDMVILSDNPYTLPKERLLDIKVEKTILAGNEYVPQSQGLLSVISKGIFGKGKY